MRYSIINCCIGLLALIGKNAANKKMIFGQGAYKVQAVIEFVRKESGIYDFEIDSEAKVENINSNFVLVFNSKFGGGHINLSPFSIMNDGLGELTFYDRPQDFSGCMKLFDESKDGGKHVYSEHGRIHRFKTLKISNKLQRSMDINIDGEELIFEKFVKFEMVPGSLGLLVDFEKMVRVAEKH